MFPSGSFILLLGHGIALWFLAWRFVCSAPAGDNQSHTACRRRCLHKLKARDNLLSILPPRVPLAAPDLPLDCCQTSPGQLLVRKSRSKKVFQTVCEVGERLCPGCAAACSVCVAVSPLPRSENAALVQQGGPGCGEQPVSHRERAEMLSEGCRTLSMSCFLESSQGL